jgi:hypothetical protein
MDEEILMVNNVELQLTCWHCKNEGVTARGLTSRGALREHLKSHGKIINPKRRHNGGHVHEDDE